MRLARLDGVRGIALLIIIAHHHTYLSHIGYIGVEFFFVLSGYLITRILRGSSTSPNYFRSFYLKRSFRLVPGLALLLIVVALTSRHASALGIVGYALFFGDVTDVSPYYIAVLAPLWSLAVEEHFYLVWPSCVRTLQRKTLLRIVCATILLEPLLRLLAMHYVGSFWTIYFLTPFRFDSIAFGSLLALLSEDAALSRRIGHVSGPTALTLGSAFLLLSALIPSFCYDANSLLSNAVTYSLASVTCFFTVAWILSLRAGSLPDRVLSSAPLLFLGRLSYGIYLFQHVVLFAVRNLLHIPFGDSGGPLERRLFPLDLLLTIAVAAVVYYLVETPTRRWGRQITRSLDTRPARSEQTLAAGGALSES